MKTVQISCNQFRYGVLLSLIEWLENGAVEMAIIPKFFFDAVVAIGVLSEKQETEWIGTGFLVGKREMNSRVGVFLVSNAHIFEEHESLVIRFNNEASHSTVDYVVSLMSNGSPSFSRHDSADVAAVRIAPAVLAHDNSSYNWFSLEDHALTLDQMKNTDVMEGSIVYSLGFPMNMVESQRKSPICRIGCISRISDLFQSGYNQENNKYLIDLQAVPGNSGAPVINRPDSIHITGTTHSDSANLIGIICGSLDYCRDDIKETCPMSNFEINSGIALVHPVDAIQDVVDLEIERTRVI